MPQEYGYLANAEVKSVFSCLVCKNTRGFSWTDYSGEGYCVDCGTPYQLKWGQLNEGETYPRCNIDPKWLPILTEYWEAKHSTNGTGTFLMGRTYADQLEGRAAFNAWLEETHPELLKGDTDA